jgi:hypothetical protein
MNLEPLRSLLKQQLGDALVAAFVYGSVAAGRAGPSSDIDCFVITADDLDGAHRRRVGMAFSSVQRALGFTPDPDYPIEVFSTEACRSILQGTDLDHMLMAAAVSGSMDRRIAESDEMEVLRALLDRRLVLRQAAVLDLLTVQAQALVRRYPIKPSPLLRVMGLVNSSPVRT